jgi:hypothetical protein
VDLLQIEHHQVDECVVAVPSGVLTLASYARLRDRLLKLAADQPMAVIVDLRDLQVEDDTLLSVFPAVAMISATPPVPLALAAGRGRLGELLGAGAIPRFVPTYPSVAAALAAAGDQPSRRRRQLDLPCTPAATDLARLWIQDVCAEWGIPQKRQLDAILRVGHELVENMVRHARTTGRLRLEQHHKGLTVAVADGSSSLPRIAPSGSSERTGGLVAVDALATAWGHHLHHPHGKTVWAVLPLPSTVMPPPAPSHRLLSLPLRTAFALTDLHVDELWLRYVGLCGSMSQASLTEILGGSDLRRGDYDILAHAFNEYFAEQGVAYSVPYAGDSELSEPD